MRTSTLIVALCAVDATAFYLINQIFHKCRYAQGDQSLVVCYVTYRSNASGVEMRCCRREQCLDLSSWPTATHFAATNGRYVGSYRGMAYIVKEAWDYALWARRFDLNDGAWIWARNIHDT